jgi:ABC-type antimicrobial peptide transport system permease subunit
MPSEMPPFGYSREEAFINETVCEEIRSLDGVKEVVYSFEKPSEETTSTTITGPRGRNFTISRSVYTIAGVLLNSSLLNEYSILPTNITAPGRNLQEGDSGAILISSNLTDHFGVGVGGEVSIMGKAFTVVGIYEQTNQGSMQTSRVYMNISDAQTITGLTGEVSTIDVYAENTSDVDGIATVIEAAYSGLSATTYKDRLQNLENMQERYSQTLANAESTLSQTQTTATQEIIIAVAATSLIVLFVMLYTVRERTKEIGTLKAIGFSNLNVMSQFVLEGMLISMIAGVVGIAIGSVGAPVLSSLLLPQVNLFGGSASGRFRSGLGSTGLSTASRATTVTLSPQLILLAFGAAVLLGAFGSLYPAWRAARIRPAEAMRYE